jgi:hypothetical protein
MKLITEHHSGYVEFVLGNHLVSTVVHFHCFPPNAFVVRFVMVDRPTVAF